MILIGNGSFKASKGLIRVKIQVENKKLTSIIISGDFFMYPEDGLWKLENNLVGTSINKTKILSKIRRFYEETNLLTPGVNPEDFMEAIMRSIKSFIA